MLMTDRYARADAYRRIMEWIIDMWERMDIRGFKTCPSWLAWHIGLLGAGVTLLAGWDTWIGLVMLLAGMTLSMIIEAATGGYHHERVWGCIHTRAYMLITLIEMVGLLTVHMGFIPDPYAAMLPRMLAGSLIIGYEACRMMLDLRDRWRGVERYWWVR